MKSLVASPSLLLTTPAHPPSARRCHLSPGEEEGAFFFLLSTRTTTCGSDLEGDGEAAAKKVSFYSCGSEILLSERDLHVLTSLVSGVALKKNRLFFCFFLSDQALFKDGGGKKFLSLCLAILLFSTPPPPPPPPLPPHYYSQCFRGVAASHSPPFLPSFLTHAFLLSGRHIFLPSNKLFWTLPPTKERRKKSTHDLRPRIRETYRVASKTTDHFKGEQLRD